MSSLRLALAQINQTVGDLTANTDRILRYIDSAVSQGADIIAFPELAITGYPPEDLLFKSEFLDEAEKCLETIKSHTSEIMAVVGTPTKSDNQLFNSAAVIFQKKLVARYNKIFLPNYGVFDEQRYFQQGNECTVIAHAGIDLGVCICEDIWYDPGACNIYRSSGAQLVININGSPFHQGKGAERAEMLHERSVKNQIAIAYCNLVGGQDELVFDGQSCVYNHSGELIARSPQFQEDLLITDIDIDAIKLSQSQTAQPEENLNIAHAKYFRTNGKPKVQSQELTSTIHAKLDPTSEVYEALVLGTRDYVNKVGFKGAIIGLSGGIDSALTTSVAVDALGHDKVSTIFMPSKFTSEQSEADSIKLSENLKVRMHSIPISPIYDAYLTTLSEILQGYPQDVTEENIQARIRGNLLMALSNKFGSIVLTTGNKSEMATGYSTLYGDLAGGFAVIKDVPKLLVWDLCKHINRSKSKEIIPISIINRPPTAELRPNQKDEDSLPPYEILDAILEAYVENHAPTSSLHSININDELLKHTLRLVDRSEYKRRQAPPGVKISPRAFGRDWRLPIVNRFAPYQK